jgi:hypothetical protein
MLDSFDFSELVFIMAFDMDALALSPSEQQKIGGLSRKAIML